MRVTVLNKQSLPDLAIQEFGSLESVLALTVKNDLPITAELEVGQEVQYDAAKTDKKVVEYLTAQKAKPATDLLPADLEAAPYGGIGFMGIEIDFIVS
jgi:hypothetical protein